MDKNSKPRSPWFLSELDALCWEREHAEWVNNRITMPTKKIEPPKLDPPEKIPYVYTAEDSRDIREEFRQAVNLIAAGDEISMSACENSVVVVATGPMTVVVVQAIKKLMEEIVK